MTPEERKEYRRQWYKTHREQEKEYNRQWIQTHKERLKKHKHQYYQTHKEQQKEYNRQYRKKLGENLNFKQFRNYWKLCFPDAFERLLVIQEDRCAVCGVSLEHHQIHVDHDHKTGLVRGLLCWHCNRYRVAQNRSDNIRQVNEYLLNPPAIQLE